jgi:hypothetical protein
MFFRTRNIFLFSVSWIWSNINCLCLRILASVSPKAAVRLPIWVGKRRCRFFSTVKPLFFREFHSWHVFARCVFASWVFILYMYIYIYVFIYDSVYMIGVEGSTVLVRREINSCE